MEKNVMLNMTVDGSPMCEPHESIPQALMRATELSREHQLSHVTIKKAASKRGQSSSLELPSESGFSDEIRKGGDA